MKIILKFLFLFFSMTNSRLLISHKKNLNNKARKLFIFSKSDPFEQRKMNRERCKLKS